MSDERGGITITTACSELTSVEKQAKDAFVVYPTRARKTDPIMLRAPFRASCPECIPQVKIYRGPGSWWCWEILRYIDDAVAAATLEWRKCRVQSWLFLSGAYWISSTSKNNNSLKYEVRLHFRPNANLKAGHGRHRCIWISGDVQARFIPGINYF